MDTQNSSLKVYKMGWIPPKYIKISGNHENGWNAEYISSIEAYQIIKLGNPEKIYIFSIRDIKDDKPEFLK